MKKLVPLLLLVLLLLVGYSCGPITLSGEEAAIKSFEADPSSISAGESSTLRWETSGASKVSIDQGIGNVAQSGTRLVTPSATTVYTLTAMSTTGLGNSATTQVVVTGAVIPTPTPTPTPIPTPTPTPTPPPTPISLPIINFFMADPSMIPYGGSSTLGWDVSNATSVTIDNGVGPVPFSGATVVSPTSSTTYTLTATNAAGWISLPATVMVGAAPAAGMPDLIIEEVVRGSTITYIIKNQGDGVAKPSTTTISIDGVPVANDSVGSLAPGESRTESFGVPYTCGGMFDAIVVTADTGSAVVESSEVNNSRSESWGCIKKVFETL